MAEYYSIVDIYHIFFIHLSIGRHLDFFHVLAIVNDAEMNVKVQKFLPKFSICLEWENNRY